MKNSNDASIVDPVEKLSSLRQIMQDLGIAVFFLPSQDAHDSEYVGDRDKRREWLTGFTGSVAYCVITQEKALMWTDGRYYLQAAQQLPQCWELMKMGNPGVPTYSEWLRDNTPSSGSVGIDPQLTSIVTYRNFVSHLGADRIELLPSPNLVDRIWANQPLPAAFPIVPHPQEFTGKSCDDKLKELREKMQKEKTLLCVVAGLDEIAYMLNLRGGDIPYTPVFLSYWLVPLEGNSCLFVHSNKLTEETQQYLKSINVDVCDYDTVCAVLKKMSGDEFLQSQSSSSSSFLETIWMDPSCNYSLFRAVENEKKVKVAHTPIMMMKAVKTPEELEGARQAHIRDGFAKSQFLHFVETEVGEGRVEDLSEVDLADKLENFRKIQPSFKDLSFPSISSVGSNGAVIHYKPERKTAKTLTRKDMYLIDSGAQYLDGTTDVTRTLCLGDPTDYQRETFTLVLKGHIQLALAVFPRGTTGPQLDAFARQALWRTGLDYLHGTGHGVGSYLGVHEGPMNIASKGNNRAGGVGLVEGMILSNEPGYYKDGEFGIRIENLVTVVKKETKYTFPEDGSRASLGFENLTMIPIQKKLIDKSLLTQEEVDYLNKYHQEVQTKLTSFARTSKQTPPPAEGFHTWLESACAPL